MPTVRVGRFSRGDSTSVCRLRSSDDSESPVEAYEPGQWSTALL